MDIILLENVEDLGMVGQTVRVKDGYARNYLLPRKLACVATQENRNFYRTLIEAKQRKLARLKVSAQQQAQELRSVVLTFIRKSRDEEARLFGSVTNADIARALESQGYEIDRKRINLPEPIKKLGEHRAIIRLHPEVTATVTVLVKPEEEKADAG
ncbi:MAG: 50S ribosomal protein L9 [Deltaproteobacteria bacterium]|nr:50S ribosomal protein L9 [Deltaproteobacteria bacterium]